MNKIDGVFLQKNIKQRLTSFIKKNDLLINIKAFSFNEDKGSILYSNLKQKFARDIGIDFKINIFSLKEIQKFFETFIFEARNPKVNGIIVQKPSKSVISEYLGQKASIKSNYFNLVTSLLIEEKTKKAKSIADLWWEDVIRLIPLDKDIDGLNPLVIKSLEKSFFSLKLFTLPATVLAVLYILKYIHLHNSYSFLNKKILVIGRSSIFGKPFYLYLKNLGFDIDIVGKKGFLLKKQNDLIKHYDVIVSGVGSKTITSDINLKKQVILIDVGEPKGDIDKTVFKNSFFYTPVPGGVGPLTVSFLMLNSIFLNFFNKDLFFKIFKDLFVFDKKDLE